MNRVTTMKWLEIVRFELVYQLRRRSTWFIFALFLFPLIGVTNDALIDARNREILFHAPLFIAESSVIMSLIALLVLAGVAGDAATRDVQTRLEPLMHAAPISPAAYVGGRFLGAFAVAAILLAVVPPRPHASPPFPPGPRGGDRRAIQAGSLPPSVFPADRAERVRGDGAHVRVGDAGAAHAGKLR